jgi:hypothetical protein
MAAVRASRRRLPPWAAWQVGWVVAFSVGHGVNTLLSLAGFTMFRATNRYSIAIMAAALLFLTQALTGATWRWPRWRRACGAAALCAFVIWDQVPSPLSSQPRDTIERRVASDRAFAEDLEKRLPPGAMIFQLPVMDFPEAPPIRGMESYDHFRPYLFSTRLRYSFGDHKANAAAAWARSVGALPIDELAGRVSEARFSAILVNRTAYRDRGAALVKALRAAGWAETIQSPDGEAIALLRAGRWRTRGGIRPGGGLGTPGTAAPAGAAVRAPARARRGPLRDGWPGTEARTRSG